MIALLAVVSLAITPPPSAGPSDGEAAPANVQAADVAPALRTIEDLRSRVRAEPTPDGQRRAADELQAVQRQLVKERPDDPRQALWMGDYAEDCFTLVLPAGGDVDRVLYGIAGAEARRRVRSVVSDMLGVAEEAERRAKATLSLPPDRGVPRDVADRLANVERPRRIPLLRALAEVLQVEVGEFEAGRRRSLAEAAIARVETLLPELDDRTASVVARYAGLAAARIEDERAASRLLRVAKERAGDDEALATLADLATLRAAGLLRGPGSAVQAASVIRGSGSPARRLAMTELEARLRRQNEAERRVDGAPTTAAPEWTSPFTEVLRGGTPAEVASLRDAGIARLVEVRAEGTSLPVPEPMALLAETQAMLDAGQDAASLRAPLEALASADEAPRAARAGANRALARMDMARQAWSEAADRFLRLALEHREDPAAAAAMGVAVQLAREVDRAADGADPAARERLERSVVAGLSGFPEHPDRGVWRLDRQALMAEARAEGRSPDLGTDPGEATAVADGEVTDALRRRIAAAEAWLRMRDGDAAGAMALMDARPPPPAGRGAGWRLAARIAAMAELDRDLTMDAEISDATRAEPAEVSRLTAARLAQSLPPQRLPVQAATSRAADAGTALRLAALLRKAGCTDAGAWIDAGDLLRLRGEPEAAIEAYASAIASQPDAREALLGQAEALRAAGGAERLAAAMGIHRRLLGGRDLEADPARRDHAWWLGQLRQLQILEASGRLDEKAVMRVNRLRALDPALGGETFAAAFDALRLPGTP